MELRRSQRISNARSSGLILSRYIEEESCSEEEENAGEPSGIVVDEVIENKDNNESPMVLVPQQPLPVDLTGTKMKVDERKSKKKEKPVLLWQLREEELEKFVHTIMSQTKHINYMEKDYESEMLNETAEASSDFIVPLLRFQKEWLAWALDQEKSYGGGVLADEMGMGKTMEAIALVLAKRELQQNGFAVSQSHLPSSSVELPLVKGTLVICPVEAITQWVNEIDRCTLKGSTSVLVYYGADRIKNSEQFLEYDFVITSYSIVESECRNMLNWCDRNCEGPSVRQAKHSQQVKKNKSNAMPALHAVKWHRIVLDEARHIKDKRSKTTQAVFALESTFKWALSGTPFQNRPRELYPLMRFLQINPYSYYFCIHCDCRVLHHRNELCSDCSHGFGDHFNWWNKYIAKPIESSRFNDICGKKAMILLTHKILKNLVLRRTKIGRAADLALPPRTVSVRRDFLDREELDYYETVYKELRAKFDRYNRENTTRLHSSKIKALIITGLCQATNHRYLVEFSQSKELSVENRACNASDKQESGICHEPEEDPVDLTSNEDVKDQDDKIMRKYLRSSRILKKIEPENFQTSTKLEALREEIRFMIERDGSAKGIVFSQFTLFVDLIYYSLDKSGVSCVLLNQNMSRAERDAVVNRFNVDPDCRIFVMTSEAGGIALNLTVASHVFIMDPFWKPALELQALDRIHGIGQYKTTRVVKFVIADTVEEKFLKRAENMKLVLQV